MMVPIVNLKLLSAHVWAWWRYTTLELEWMHLRKVKSKSSTPMTTGLSGRVLAFQK